MPTLEEMRQAQALVVMPLAELASQNLAVRILSSVLQREVWFVSTLEAGRTCGATGAVFIAEELALLLQASPTPGDLKAIVEAKEALGCRLREVIEGPEEPG